MTHHDRAAYLSYIQAFPDETLQLEADDAFINMCSDPDESLHYVMCIEEQKRRDTRRKYGDYEKHATASLVRPI
jgi:hypothetical protein